MSRQDLGVRPKPSRFYVCAVATGVASVVVAVIGVPVLGWWGLALLALGVGCALTMMAVATIAKATGRHRFQVFTHLRENADD